MSHGGARECLNCFRRVRPGVMFCSKCDPYVCRAIHPGDPEIQCYSIVGMPDTPGLPPITHGGFHRDYWSGDIWSVSDESPLGPHPVIHGTHFLARIQARGTFTIPNEIRDVHGLAAGDIIQFDAHIIKKRGP